MRMFPTRPSAVVLAAFLGSFSGSGFAGIITTGCEDPASCLLLELTNGGTIQVDDKLFSEFRFDPTASDPALEAFDITVAGTGIDTNAPGLRFSSADEFGAGSRQNRTFIISFNVAVVPGSTNRITDVLFELNAAQVAGTGSITGLEVANCRGASGVQPRRELNVTAGQPNDKADTQAPATSCAVFKRLELAGGADGSALLPSFDNQFSQTAVPEPPTWILFGTVVLLGLLRRARSERFRKA